MDKTTWLSSWTAECKLESSILNTEHALILTFIQTEQCANVKNHLINEVMEFWKSARLLIPAQNINYHHFFPIPIAVNELKCQWTTCCENTELSMAFFQDCFESFYQIVVRKKTCQDHMSFPSPLDASPCGPLSLVHLMLNITFDTTYSLLAMCRTNLLSVVSLVLSDMTKKTEISISGFSFKTSWCCITP